MRQVENFERPKTSRVYLHPYLSGRNIMTYPDMKVTDTDLRDVMDDNVHGGIGVHAVFGNEPIAADIEKTEWKKCKDGIPVYTMYNKDAENGCDIAMTTFCSKDKVPFTYIELTVTNNTENTANGTFGLLPRYAKPTFERYLHNEHGIGYDSYNPGIQTWYMLRKNSFAPTKENPLIAVPDNNYGFVAVTEHENCNVRWVSRDEIVNRFKAQDYYRFDYTLGVGESAKVVMVMHTGDICTAPSIDEALKDTTEFWQNLLSKTTVFPKKEEFRDMYLLNITQLLQMFQIYESEEFPNDVHMRQGDYSRFEWIYEASYCFDFLDRAGFSDIVTPAIRKWYTRGQMTDGEEKGRICHNLIWWDSNNGMALLATARHLLTRNDKALFDEFKPRMDLALEYIQYRRSLCTDKEIKGLFNSGRASDWADIAQHWTFTDAPNVDAIRHMLKCYEHFGADNTEYVRSVYEDYKGVIDSIRDKFAKEHKGEHSYNMPHMLGVGDDFEDTYNHCFMTDGAPNLIYHDLIDINSELFTQMENFYTESGVIDTERGLCARMTDTDFWTTIGIYGNVYYMSVSEFYWMKAWHAKGEYDKVRKSLDAILKYLVTPEYICSERYCSVDPWYTPIQPNASGSARLCMMLLDYLD